MNDAADSGSWSPAVDEILSVGEKPTALGSWNWVLPKAVALEAVRKIGDLGLGVLGGDVYRREGAELVFDYAGWHSDPLPNEPVPTFVTRSVGEAINYISSYPNEVAVFSIVPQIERS